MNLPSAWLRRGPLACALWPLSLLYGVLSGLHRLLYRMGLRTVRRLPVPVVVVGNVVAGGAGKTPVVAAVVAQLRADGWRPGIISRGYGRRGAQCLEVTPATPATLAGDEPLLLARTSAVPVFVAASRFEAGTALLRQYPQVDVLVSDDGLQHHGLARDLEVCVFDDRGTGNGWLLPAGPLREPWPRRTDFVLRPPALSGLPGFDMTRRLAPLAVRADGQRRSLTALAAKPVVALAGIARPEAFFDMLREAGLQPARAIALPDHHDFEARPPQLPGDLADMPCVCTEKDAVKLWRTHPGAWAVPLEVSIEPAFWAALRARLGAPLSSADGPQTA